MRRLALCSLLLLLGGCAADMPAGETASLQDAPAAELPKKTPTSLTKAEIAAVQSGMKRDLKQQAVARFDGLRGFKTPAGAVFVCGWVNPQAGDSKRTAFVGQLLRSSAPQFKLTAIGTDAAELNLVKGLCPNIAAATTA